VRASRSRSRTFSLSSFISPVTSVVTPTNALSDISPLKVDAYRAFHRSYAPDLAACALKKSRKSVATEPLAGSIGSVILRPVAVIGAAVDAFEGVFAGTSFAVSPSRIAARCGIDSGRSSRLAVRVVRPRLDDELNRRPHNAARRRHMVASAPSSDDDDGGDVDVAVVDPDGAAFASMSDESINASLAPSIYALTRALKRASLGVFHCVHSVAMDAAFVAEQRRRFKSVPMFANLRAGAWYVDEDVRECYFKSTDGHFGNWQFSATRLNAHVAREAARAGGCVIVDATRSSVKRFPDALAKTIPIWADTWNRAREAALTKRDGRETDWLRTSSAANGPHLPDWISANEQNSIRAKIGEYASAFNALDVDALEATESLAKPFRCVWISQAECGLEFELKDAERDGYTPIILVTASAPLHWRGERRASANGTSFAYIPGAGDDEESWAGGLTPAMFRTHKDALLDACERDIGSTIARIVEGRVDAPRKLDPRARFAAKGCEVDAEVAERISQQSGYIREGATRRLAAECGLGECLIASSAVYDRQDVAEVADSFLHVGELKAPSAATLRSFMHARAQKVKLDRSGLTKIFPNAIKFASEAVRNGERLCITCDDGVDHSVAVAVAASMKLTCEDPTTATKDDVRRRLALVSQSHPDARPTRGSLKQVYNYLIGESLGDDADDPETRRTT